MPALGSAGMMIPACAPSTPASKEPALRRHLAVLVLGGVLAQVPDVAGLVLGVPVVGDLDGLRHSRLTMSRITLASTPLAIILVRSRDGHLDIVLFRPRRSLCRPICLPGAIGQYGLSMRVVKSAGSSFTRSLPCGRPPGCRTSRGSCPPSSSAPHALVKSASRANAEQGRGNQDAFDRVVRCRPTALAKSLFLFMVSSSVRRVPTRRSVTPKP